MIKNDVVQFNENHKWCGCLGIVDVVKPNGACMVGVPIPNNQDDVGTAYIFAQENEIEYIGQAVMVQAGEDGCTQS